MKKTKNRTQKFHCSYVKSDGKVGTVKVEAASLADACSKIEDFVSAIYKKCNEPFDASTIVSMTVHIATKVGRPKKAK